MKNLIVVLLSFVLVGMLQSQTESYLPYISSEHTWYDLEIFPQDYPNSARFTFSVDSVFDDGWYFEKLRSTNEDGSDPVREGLYRETIGKVYKKTGLLQDELLVLDMTLVVGDTFAVQAGYLEVVTVDSVKYADSIVRKRMFLDCVDDFGEPAVWVEGIGDIGFGPHCFIEPGYKVNCYSTDELVIYEGTYQDDFYYDCWQHDRPTAFLDPQKRWTYLNAHDLANTVGSYRMKIDYRETDSLDRVYHEVLYSFNEFGTEWANSGVFLREEDDKVWQVDPDGEFLLYDFSLVVGDAFDIHIDDGSVVSTVVIGVDSISMVDGSKRKVILFDSLTQGNHLSDNEWIDGIGSTLGFLELPDSESVLLCYSEFQELIYDNEDYPNCWIVATEDIINEEVSIYPNPASGQLFISTDAQITDVVIRSITGDVVFTGPYSGTLDIEYMLSGLYFMELTDVDKLRLYLKFIKM